MDSLSFVEYTKNLACMAEEDFLLLFLSNFGIVLSEQCLHIENSPLCSLALYSFYIFPGKAWVFLAFYYITAIKTGDPHPSFRCSLWGYLFFQRGNSLYEGRPGAFAGIGVSIYLLISLVLIRFLHILPNQILPDLHTVSLCWLLYHSAGKRA